MAYIITSYNYYQEVIFIYDDLNEIVSVLLNVKRSDIELINCVDNNMYITLKKKDLYCPKCNKRLNLNGYFNREVIIPNKAFEGMNIHLKARRYRCYRCEVNISDINHMSPVNKKISYASIRNIMELLKSPKMTFKEVSNILNIPLTSVIRVFDNHCHIPRKTLPEVLCIDEVYTKNSDYKSKYSCIFYDFQRHTVVDVLPSRKKDYLHYYMKYIPSEERNNVKYVCIDMYETYRSIAKHYFKKAIICVDSFHVVKHLNDDLNKLRIRYMKLYSDNPASNEYYLLNKFRFLLLDRNIKLDGERKLNRKLGMYLNYGDILELILSINNEIRIAYELKEEYIIFNSKMNIDEAKDNYDTLLNDFISADIYEYKEFIILLKNWRQEIINSFTTIKGKRINNGIAESINQNVATIIYNTKGIRNNTRRRKRIMYSINKDGFNLY